MREGERGLKIMKAEEVMIGKEVLYSGVWLKRIHGVCIKW